MQNAHLKTAYNLSVIIILLAIIAAAGGLFINNVYRDNSFVTTVWKANDLVTICIAVPILITAIWLSKKGSIKAQLVWLGMLDYMLYNYAFYLFGAHFNLLFLVYAALFALSILALIFALVSIDAKAVCSYFQQGTPIKWVSGYMLLVATGLSFVYLTQSISFIATGQLPAIVTLTQHPTSVVFALDLSLLIPGLILGSIWLWQRKPWGFILAVIFVVKGSVYTLVLAAGSLVAASSGFPAAASEIPLWIILSIAGWLFSFLLLSNIKSPSFQTNTA
jgi:hypothetical protein